MTVRGTIVELDSPRLAPAAQLVARALGHTTYAGGALEALELAVRTPGSEARALGCVRDERVDGVIVFGAYAGAIGAGRIHLVIVDLALRRTGVGRLLVNAAVAHLRSDRARFALAELPRDEQALPGAFAFLAAMGFREESRVEDFVRDAIALSFMRRDLARGEG